VIDERIAARRAEVRDERRRGRLRRTLTIVGLVLLVVAVVVVERSDLVGLEEVRVDGAARVEPAAVLAAADLELGTSTLRLALGDAADRVTGLPGVREATARRLDPLTVLIEVEERVPVLVVEGDGTRRLVDRDGVVFADAAEAAGGDAGEDAGGEDDLGALAVVSLSVAPPEVGEQVDADATLANAHAAWAGLSGPLRTAIDRYDAAGPDELTLHLDRGVRVRFGRAERLDEKVRALGAVLGDIEGADVDVIDVRAPGAPVVVGGA
jgi:hypothetical protein